MNIQTTKSIYNIHSWCNDVKETIQMLNQLGYEVSIKYEANKEDDSIGGYYHIKLNNKYISTVGYNKKYHSFFRLYDKLETIYRTLSLVKIGEL